MRVLLDEAQLREGVARIAREIVEFYGERPVTIVAVLTGSLVFVSDLIRQLKLPLKLAVVQSRSYRGAATRPSDLAINPDFVPDVRGRDVLLVDDIFDTGHTLVAMTQQMRELGAASVRSAVLLLKQGRQEVALRPNHAGFEIPDQFVVGYGLDYNDLYRNLPQVAVLDPADMSRP